MPRARFVNPLFIATMMVFLAHTLAAEPDTSSDQPGEQDSADLLAGHSYHGEVFNEGPRQHAYLMDGLGRVNFPVTAQNPFAQRYVTQGVAQLHGFWYFEAERSFRQAAAVDPDCGMAYWGMAMANMGNAKRAQGFLAEAVKHKDKLTRRESLYIDALNDYFKHDPKKKKERAEQYTRALEKLIYEFPDDVEAKAFLALQLWSNRSSEIPITSYLAVDALLEQVFQVEPMHPAHHYRIHLWDYEKPERALESAARCGQSLPAIAHMWHMPGHIYSRLNRYQDAVWQQEASARVDHAHMMRDRVLPDQIHNFAHNNEWLIRNLNFIGRFRDAVDLAKNMIELPRHPKYNTLEKRGSGLYGRQRLLETLTNFELWEELVALAGTPYLEPTDLPAEQATRLRHLGRAYFGMADLAQGQAQIDSLQRMLDDERAKRDRAATIAESRAREDAFDQVAIDKAVAEAVAQARAAGSAPFEINEVRRATGESTRVDQVKAKAKEIEKAKEDAEKPFGKLVRDLEKAIQELEGLQLLARQQPAEALPLLRKAGGVDPMFLAHVQFDAGDSEAAIKAARKHVASHPHEVRPLAMLAELLWKANQRSEATKVFQELREAARDAELDSRVFQRLGSISKAGGWEPDWRLAIAPATDTGVRPPLDSLGPFRWRPSPAPDFVLADPQGKSVALKEYRGRPLVLIFYLGYGCLHCAEQLREFGPLRDKYLEAGIDMLAVSSDDESGLKISIANYQSGLLPIPLLANGKLDVFKEYRAYDDFERQPLHATFLIDSQGLIRWQDVSYEPFMDAEFLLQESVRLLSQADSDFAKPAVAAPDATARVRVTE